MSFNKLEMLPARPDQSGSALSLLRKEVIQPHVPVGLPCYDLAPVTDLTFGGFVPCGFGHRLRVLPASIA